MPPTRPLPTRPPKGVHRPPTHPPTYGCTSPTRPPTGVHRPPAYLRVFIAHPGCSSPTHPPTGVYRPPTHLRVYIAHPPTYGCSSPTHPPTGVHHPCPCPLSLLPAPPPPPVPVFLPPPGGRGCSARSSGLAGEGGCSTRPVAPDHQGWWDRL